jgi:hypothetical protein
MAQSPDYWPTLFWQGPPPAKKVSSPLISRNTAKLLERLAGTSLQPETGIVFGRIAGGIRVEFSARAERVLYFDAQNHVIDGTDLSGARSFALVNAAPGARIVYTSSNAGLAIPVIAGTATYLDLTQLKKFPVRGKVLDGSSQGQRPLRGSRVTVAGFPGASVETDAQGAFDLGEITGIEGFPLYLETEMNGSYTHRYRVDTGKAAELTLFRMTNDQIETWISQLEGGISNQSALVLAALPDLLSSSNDPQYFATLRTLAANPTLVPETYTLSPAGQLEVGVPVQRQQPRFLSVQIPEGPAIAQLEDKGKRIFWSELVMASPNVINLIGPY